MALKQNISNSNYPSVVRATLGITEDVQELYIKIEAIYSDNKPNLDIRVGFYNFQKVIADEEETITPIKLSIPEIRKTITLVIDGEEGDYNPWKQAYEYLKTLPEFAGCEDC